VAKKAPLKKKTPVIEPKAVREVEVEEVEETEGNISVEGNETFVFAPGLYTVKIDNKKFDNRTLPQVHALLSGVDGDFKKLVIEPKK
jgi:hypothetical protein